MRYYAPDTNRKGKHAGIIALACYIAVFVCVCLLVSFDLDNQPEEHSEGILIDFGDDVNGLGADNVALAENITSSASAQSGENDEEIITQENEEVPAIKTSPEKTKHTNKSSSLTKTKTDSKQTILSEQPKEINRKALFPGRSTTSNAVSQGNTSDISGNIGSPLGGDGSATGTGVGESGVSFNLAGRRPVGNLPRPLYTSDSEGRVVVEISVDSQGRVQTASFRPQGSTTQDVSLREAALKAAKQARFTTDENNAVQTGSITYIFKLQ